MFSANLKDLEGKIVEVMIAAPQNKGAQLAYIGRLQASGIPIGETIVLKPAAAVHQIQIRWNRTGNHLAEYGRDDEDRTYAKPLSEVLAKDLTAQIGRDHIVGVHESIYTAEQLSLKKE